MSDPSAAYLNGAIAALERVQRTICAYGGSIPCDCKYGGPSLRAGSEATGCPELRDALGLLRNMGRVLSGEPVMTAADWRKCEEVMNRAQ